MNRQDAIEEALLMHLHRIDALVAKLIDLRVNHFIMPSPEECDWCHVGTLARLAEDLDDALANWPDSSRQQGETP